MTRPEIEAKLIELAAEIERAQTAIWLAEFEREQLRNELRRLLRGEPGESIGEIPQCGNAAAA